MINFGRSVGVSPFRDRPGVGQSTARPVLGDGPTSSMTGTRGATAPRVPGLPHRSTHDVGNRTSHITP